MSFESFLNSSLSQTSKHWKDLRYNSNAIMVSNDRKFALIILSHNPAGPETKSILIIDLQERYGNYIPNKEWKKANQLSKSDYKNLDNAAKGLRK